VEAAGKPAVQQAIDTVLKHIASGAWSDTGRLPGIRFLATMAGVSQASMWKALQVLKQRKAVEGFAGRRFRIPRAASVTAAESALVRPAALPSRGEALKQELERDILNGAFGPGGALPTLKELGHRYGASYPALKGALEQLRHESLLRRYKRAYRCENAVPSRSHARITLLCLGNFAELLRMGRPRNQEFLREVERECMRRGIGLGIYAHSIVDGRESYFDKNGGELRSLPRDYDALGFLCHSPGCELPAEVLKHASRLRKPVAVMDEAGMPVPQFPRVQPFPFASFQTGYDQAPGERVGRYLLQLGHRAVAYLSPFHATTWSVNRGAGLRKVFAAAGCPEGVSSFTMDEFAYPQDFVQQMIDSHKLAPLLRECDRAEAGFPVKLVTSLERLRDRVLAHLAPEEIGMRLAPLFDQALGNRAITAWVGANDTVALAALQYLRRHGTALVPQRLSVVGFDNTLDSFSNNLTSYDFNIPLVVRSMIDFVIDPSLPAMRRQGTVRHVEGIIVERGTTRVVGVSGGASTSSRR
jgi:DNA-binding LacI/PurR family transcriptional regulator/DNA-binding transcriptional regulator YhcF (GntR family)